MMKEHDIFFSIVIPTRNRHDTLYYAIKTILQQSFTNYELIICDNNSSPETKDVVDSFVSKKIRYIRSDTDLAMTENWELAVSHAQGKYITVIADNDGFIDGSLQYLYDMLSEYNFPNIIRWDKNGYYWPDMDVEHIKRLVLRTDQKVEVLQGNTVIRDVLSGDTNFHMLPMIYCSIISSTMLESIKAKTGRVFNSLSPDVYSGYAFAYLAKAYISISTPITINGTSKKSNGYNTLKKTSSVSSDFFKLGATSKFPVHPKVPIVRTIFFAFFDSFLRAQEDLEIKDILLDNKYMLDKLISTAIVYDNEDLLHNQNIILKTVSKDDELFSYAQKAIKRLSITMPTKSKRKLGFYEDILYLDGEAFNINNIYEASKYMSNFYNYLRVF